MQSETTMHHLQALAALPVSQIAGRLLAKLLRHDPLLSGQAIEGLDVRESTWTEWEETCAAIHSPQRPVWA